MWIDVITRQPEKKQHVLCFLKNSSMILLEYKGQDFFDHIYPLDPDFVPYYDRSPVTHWAPLPNPPKDKNDNVLR